MYSRLHSETASQRKVLWNAWMYAHLSPMQWWSVSPIQKYGNIRTEHVSSEGAANAVSLRIAKARKENDERPSSAPIVGNFVLTLMSIQTISPNQMDCKVIDVVRHY